MNSAPSPAKQIFLGAVEKYAPDKWPEYLDDACGEDTNLRRRVEVLLEAHVADASLLDAPAVEIEPTMCRESPISERPGEVIGPYKLLEQIGEGGFGVVFLAEQTRPVRREVALKVVKAGMDTKEVVARFEAERQALAMMDHPNIAKVLGAGATESGRPYFVMELVRGIPITEYCDQCKLTTRERLGLLVSVCQAVQHAHQKGVIHRDLKPSNVLIAMQDGRPVPKIIDFGVAKAINQRLTEHTLKTRYAQIIGTPLYMSPEQAELSPLGVDTRSDIYSLGVLLYELLTGTTPFDKDRLHSASFDELRQIIREEEPPRPSTRLSTLAGEMAQTVADCHRTEVRQLMQTVRGDLDWIVMKAMEKDRNRRYESASSLARDVERYLHDEPVEACPPSATYRFRKYMRRNKATIATLGLVAAALLVGAGVASWQAVRATRQRDRAVLAEAAAAEQAQRADEEAKKAADEAAISKAVNDFLNKDLLAHASPFFSTDRDVTLRDVVDRASENVESRFQDSPLVKAAIYQTLAEIYQTLGDSAKSESHSRRAIELRQRTLGENDPSTLESMHMLSISLWHLDRFDESEALARRIIEIIERDSEEETEILSGAYNQVGICFHSRGKLEEARPYYRKAVEISRRVHDKTRFNPLVNLANVTPDKAEKVRLLREAMEIAKSEYGEDHVWLVSIMYWLAVSLGPESQEGAELNRKALEICLRDLGPEHRFTIRSLTYEQRLATEQAAREGDYDRAIKSYSLLIERLPEDEIAWLHLAPVLVLSENEAAYQSYCHRLMENFRGTTDPSAADVVCKASLLWPNVVEVNELPVGVMVEALEDGNAEADLVPWLWADRALVAYRSGNPESAVKLVESSQASNPRDITRALGLVVLAMARHDLEQRGEADQALREATDLIDSIQQDPENPANGESIHDLLIARILLKEADTLINADERPDTTGSLGTKNTILSMPTTDN